MWNHQFYIIKRNARRSLVRVPFSHGKRAGNTPHLLKVVPQVLLLVLYQSGNVICVLYRLSLSCFFLFLFFPFLSDNGKKQNAAPPQPTIALPVQRILDVLISSLACVYCCELVTNRQAPLQRLFLSCYILLSIKILIWLASQKRQDPGCCAGTDLPAPWWSNLALTM